METRENLRPFKKQRLCFEGVLIDIVTPQKKNKHQYGLVFGSVYAPNENVELDHAVIQISKEQFEKAKLERYTRYMFTAEVAPYFKLTRIMGVSVNQENFMLKDINFNRLKESHFSHMAQPTAYVMRRIQTMVLYKGELKPSKNELLEAVLNTPNEGSVERFINECTESYQRTHVNQKDLEEVLYG